MILYYGEIRLKAFKYKKPVMEKHKGRLWVKKNIYIDKKPVTCHLDSKFGSNIHFEYKNVQYRFSMMGEYYDELTQRINRYQFNPLTEEVNFYTNPFTASKNH